MKALRPHWREPVVDVAWTGEGWRDLVAACHSAVADRFPDYELLAVEQKHGLLAFQAFPRPWSDSSTIWTPAELSELHAILETFVARSAIVCEWCGGNGLRRDERDLELTLCDQCNDTFSDPPQPGLDEERS